VFGAVLALTACAVTPALAATIVVDGRTVAVPVPDGYCELGPALVAQLLGNESGETRGAYMVDCTDLTALRYGSPIAAHAVIVQVPHQFRGTGDTVTRADVARRFNERLVGPNLGQWTVLGHMRLHVLQPYSRGRDDEAIANAEIEYMGDRRLVRQGAYVAATALRGVPVVVTWTWPSGRDEAATTGPRLLTFLDELKAKNPEISMWSGLGWNRILFTGIGALGLLWRARRLIST
jgi:hypothetical protein